MFGTKKMHAFALFCIVTVKRSGSCSCIVERGCRIAKSSFVWFALVLYVSRVAGLCLCLGTLAALTRLIEPLILLIEPEVEGLPVLADIMDVLAVLEVLLRVEKVR